MGAIIAGIANLLGYVLNLIYNIVNNYGVSIIIFTILLRLLMIPINFKQTKNLKKSAIIQEKTKELQKLYADNQEQMNKEIMNLYKENNMSPFSGCLTSIVTLFLFISVFYIVSRPLTYMRHLDQNIVTQYTEEIYNTNSNGENIVSNEVASIENTTSNNSNNRRTYPEIAIIREKGDEDERVHLNMNFLGLDLSDIPSQNYSNWTVFIIPVLYVLTTFVSLKLNEKMTKKRKEDAVANKVVTERIVSRNENKEEKMLVPTEKTEDDEMIDTMSDMTKTMTWMMPIMSVSISLIAPLGLALYWLVGNIFMIVERIVTNKIIEKEDK
jgi:YidC/Oxa1 family membrane protein insertase